MENKICNKCKKSKPIECFNIRKDSKDGFRNECKSCWRIATKKYQENNKEKQQEYRRKNWLINKNDPDYIKKRAEWVEKNKESIVSYHAKWRKKNDKYKKEKDRQYYEVNKEKILDYHKKYYKSLSTEAKEKICIRRREIMPEYNRKYYLNNYEKERKRSNEWRKNNLSKVREYTRNRRKNDPLFKLSSTLRCRINDFLKNKNLTKKQKTNKLLGCTLEVAKAHIERQFKKGMTWDNHGYYTWHIDHVIPLSSANTEEELKQLFHYRNLQPLWAKDNLSKGSNIVNVQVHLPI